MSMTLIDLGMCEAHDAIDINYRKQRTFDPATAPVYFPKDKIIDSHLCRPTRPFRDIGRDTNGTQKKYIWKAGRYLYENEFYNIVRSAMEKVNFDDIVNHPNVIGETVQSLTMLRDSFEQVEKIDRLRFVGKDKMVLEFTFVSRYTTINGSPIKLKVNVLVTYKPEISWSTLTLNLVLGGGEIERRKNV